MSVEPYDYGYGDDDIQTDVEVLDEFMPPDESGQFSDQRYGRVSSGTSAPSFSYVNESGLPDDVVENYMRRSGSMQEIASIVERWSQSLNTTGTTQTLDVFNRQRWQNNETHMHAVMSRVAWACENDYTLSTLADVVEGLMWNRCRFELIDLDQQDMWNQWAADVNLDQFLRQVGREEFKLSQFYVGLWWSRKVYSVQDDLIEDQIDEFEAERKRRDFQEAVQQRQAAIDANKGNPDFIAPPEVPEPPDLNKGPGNRKRKKKFPVTVPTEMTIFDPTKVLPVGALMFGRERFAYIANRSEHEAFTSVMQGDLVDETVFQLIEKKYDPTPQDIAACADLGVDHNMLWLFKKDAIFRHTLTRSHYERYAPVRLKPILRILEMKEHLANSDRATLIGNALRWDQRVATPNGWVPIGQLHEGDLVMGRNGRPTRVAGVFPQGERPLFRVQFSDGAEVIADENHRWAVATKSDVFKGRPHQVLTTGEILERGLRDRVGQGNRWSVPMAEPVQFPEADLPVDPYLLGVLLGDGGMTQATPRITWAEPDQPWRTHLPADVSVTKYGSDENPSWGLRGIKWRQNSLTAALRKLGLMGGRGETKFVPESYLTASVEQRRELIRGLFDTDGCPAQPGGVEYSTTSRMLAADVVELVQSLGGVATLKTKEAVGRNRESYRVYASLPDAEAPFKRARKIAKWVPRKTRVVRSIVAIEPVASDEAVCIAVEAEDQLFLTEGYVATHNTNFIVVITKGTDRLPARPAEIANLQEQARVIARLPVLVGDHRLKVEIVAPAVDHTLMDSRWQLLDARLVFAALRTYSPVTAGAGANSSSGSAGVTEMSRIVAKGLESRRHMIMRTMEKAVFQAVLDKNADLLDEMPTLLFNPKRITLNFQADVIQQVLQLRDRGDISRETALEELNYDQDTEVLRRGRERALYDKIFESQTPYSSPASNPYAPAAIPGATPGQAIPGVRPPQLPPGGNQNVVGNGGDPAVGGRGGKKAVAKPGGRPSGVQETQPRKSPNS